MGFRDTLQPTFGALFSGAFAEAVSQFTGSYLGQGSHDPVEGTTTAETITYAGRGVISDFELEKIDELNIKTGDAKAIVLANEVGDTPDVGHRLVADKGNFIIFKASMDAVQVAYKLHLRRV